MKILMTAWGSPGGADRMVQNTRRALLGKGHKVDILYRNPDSFGIVDPQGRDVYFENVADVFQAKKYDVLHTNSLPFTKGDHFRIGGMPRIYHGHSLIVHETLNNPARMNVNFKKYIDSLPEGERERTARALLRANDPQGYLTKQEAELELSDAVVNLTRYGEKIFASYYPEHVSKSVIIPNGTDFGKLAFDRDVEEKAQDIKKERGKPIILYTGRIIPEKGIADLSLAYNIIRRRGIDSSLVLVGAGDQKLVTGNVDREYLGDVKVVNWVDSDTELAAYYKAANVLVVPSYSETFCLAALEAASLGTPVVISDVDGPHEVFVQPMLAYGITPGNVGQIADRVEWILRNPGKAKYNAAKVQSVVNQKYDINKITDAVVGLYFGVMLKEYGYTEGGYRLVSEKTGVSERAMLDALDALGHYQKR